jgi:hypothetical protein
MFPPPAAGRTLTRLVAPPTPEPPKPPGSRRSRASRRAAPETRETRLRVPDMRSRSVSAFKLIARSAVGRRKTA